MSSVPLRTVLTLTLDPLQSRFLQAAENTQPACSPGVRAEARKVGALTQVER